MEAVEGLIAPGSADRRARSETREFNNRQRSKSEGARGIDLASLMKAPKIFNLAREARQAKREVKKLRDRTRDYLEGNYEGELGDSAYTPGYSTPPSPRTSPTPPFLNGREDNLNMVYPAQSYAILVVLIATEFTSCGRINNHKNQAIFQFTNNVDPFQPFAANKIHSNQFEPFKMI